MSALTRQNQHQPSRGITTETSITERVRTLGPESTSTQSRDYNLSDIDEIRVAVKAPESTSTQSRDYNIRPVFDNAATL